MEHLSPNAIEALKLSNQDRITYIRKERWLGYPTAKTVMNQLEDLFKYPKRSRMPNLLIIGDTNNGKTTIAKHFHSKFPAFLESPEKSVVCPILYIQAPPVADESRFYASIIQRYAAPYRTSDRVEKKMNQALTLMQNTQVKMLIIDEFHHILAGNSNKHRAMLNVIKYIGNELMIPVVGIGTKDAFVAIQSDPQLSNRFDHAYLPRWKYNKEFCSLLLSLEHILPLKNKSNLTEDDKARKILALTEGAFGEIYRLLTELAVYGVVSGEEKISLDHIDKINWIAPYERAKRSLHM
ncbi:MAG TPA: TniB family NTP-binding protein [Aquella sp.]|nr:TniB family NTP-binding protein [Aquella sp.]